MMEVILYLNEKCQSLIGMGMPMAILREQNIFEKIIAIKYEVANKELDKFETYRQLIDEFYQKLIELNA